jgi:hypothetical protein
VAHAGDAGGDNLGVRWEMRQRLLVLNRRFESSLASRLPVGEQVCALGYTLASQAAQYLPRLLQRLAKTLERLVCQGMFTWSAPHDIQRLAKVLVLSSKNQGFDQ